MKYKGKFDASVHKINLIPQKVPKSYKLSQYEDFVKENISIETKKEVKDAEFNLLLEKVEGTASSSIDLKVD